MYMALRYLFYKVEKIVYFTSDQIKALKILVTTRSLVESNWTGTTSFKQLCSGSTKANGMLIVFSVKNIAMKKEENVHWNWGKSEAEGKIKEKFEKPVTKKIKGTSVKRNASKDEPAYLIEQENGNKVLKSETELKKGKK